LVEGVDRSQTLNRYWLHLEFADELRKISWVDELD
jgi:hypothetical protein